MTADTHVSTEVATATDIEQRLLAVKTAALTKGWGRSLVPSQYRATLASAGVATVVLVYLVWRVRSATVHHRR